MDKYLDDLCDEIDAVVFTGDLLHTPNNLDGFKEYVARWTRELVKLEKTLLENNADYI